MWPGRPRSSGSVSGSIRALMVAERSNADMPVVAPLSTSTDTVNAVPRRAVLSCTIMGSLSSSRRLPIMGAQISPLPCAAMKLMASGETDSAAMAKSPSFSRSSSSTIMTIRPALKSWIASCTDERGIVAASPYSSSRMSAGPRGTEARRSTYLATTSVSTLTVSPTPRLWKTVLSRV